MHSSSLLINFKNAFCCPEVSDGNESKETRAESRKEKQEGASVKEKEKLQKRMKKKDELEWENLRRKWEPMRKMYSSSKPRSLDQLDSVDWEAVRSADESVVAEVIKGRGQHNIIAGWIKVM